MSSVPLGKPANSGMNDSTLNSWTGAPSVNGDLGCRSSQEQDLGSPDRSSGWMEAATEKMVPPGQHTPSFRDQVDDVWPSHLSGVLALAAWGHTLLPQRGGAAAFGR